MDIVAVQNVGLRAADDPTVLDWAVRDGRILLTHDVSTMADFVFERVLAAPLRQVDRCYDPVSTGWK